MHKKFEFGYYVHVLGINKLETHIDSVFVTVKFMIVARPMLSIIVTFQ